VMEVSRPPKTSGCSEKTFEFRAEARIRGGTPCPAGLAQLPSAKLPLNRPTTPGKRWFVRWTPLLTRLRRVFPATALDHSRSAFWLRAMPIPRLTRRTPARKADTFDLPHPFGRKQKTFQRAGSLF